MSLKSLPYKAIFNKTIMILLKDIDNYWLKNMNIIIFF